MELSDLQSDTSSQKGIIMSQPTQGQAPVLIISVFVVALVIVNIIITAIVLGRPATPSVNVMPAQSTSSNPAGASQNQPGPVINVGTDGSSTSTAASGGRTYLIAYGHDFGAYEYIDAGGYHRGFFKELIDEVCTAAGVQCKAVFDKYINCMESLPGKHPTLGTGLQARYYDGWIGWAPTIERIHAASFTLPFTDPQPGYFFYKKGGSFSPDNLTGKTIGFLAGWADNEKCLARELTGTAGIPLKDSQIIYATDPETLYNYINDGKVQAGFATIGALGVWAADDKLEHLKTKSFTCVLGGLAVMSRADSDFPPIWNKGFQQIVTNGQLEALCTKSQTDHAERGIIACTQSYNWNV